MLQLRIASSSLRRAAATNHVALLATLVLGLPSGRALAQAKPPSQDDQLRSLLGLGDAAGCWRLLGVQQNGNDVDLKLKDLNTQIGSELRAICGSSQVTSASSQGGAINSLQATKTVAQYRLVRRRIDQRLDQRRTTRPTRQLVGVPMPLSPMQDFATDGRLAVFGEFELERRNRSQTLYETGYEADVGGLTIGVDYLLRGGVVGAWIGQANQDAALNENGPLIGSPFGATDEAFRRLLNDATVRAAVCGAAPAPGSFTQSATRAGGFAGRRLGDNGFVDIAISASRRAHESSRGLCAIENQGTPAFAANVIFNDANSNGRVDAGEIVAGPGRGLLFNDANNNGVVNLAESVFDDIFAGTLRGRTNIQELSASFRTGADYGGAHWRVGPRVSATVSRATTSAYAETGSSSADNRVRSNDGTVIVRALGGPIGLELAYDAQSRASVLLDAGAEIAYRMTTRRGDIVPHASAMLRHEFVNDLQIVTVRLAQDLRATPTRFTFATDGRDPNAALITAGVSAELSTRASARIEVTHLVADSLYRSGALSAQFRWRF